MKEKCLLLHGWGANGQTFARVKAEFASEFDVFTPDFKGFGTAPEPLTAQGVSEYCRDISEYIHSEIKSETHVVGHSFGGRVAIYLAVKNPELIRSLVLVDSAGIRPKLTHKQAKNIKKFKQYKRAVQDGRMRAEALAEFGSTDYKVLSEMMKLCFVRVVNEDLTPLLPQIRAKTLIFWGKYDKDTPLYMAKKMKKLIPQSELVVAKGGHFSFLDCENEFISSCYKFWGV